MLSADVLQMLLVCYLLLVAAEPLEDSLKKSALGCRKRCFVCGWDFSQGTWKGSILLFRRCQV